MTMRCKKCRELTKVARGDSERNHSTDAALGVYTRWRLCNCGDERPSVEVWQEDLAELRRKAYLYELSKANEWKTL